MTPQSFFQASYTLPESLSSYCLLNLLLAGCRYHEKPTSHVSMLFPVHNTITVVVKLELDTCIMWVGMLGEPIAM